MIQSEIVSMKTDNDNLRKNNSEITKEISNNKIKYQLLNDTIDKTNHEMNILNTKISMIGKENKLLKSW